MTGMSLGYGECILLLYLPMNEVFNSTFTDSVKHFWYLNDMDMLCSLEKLV